MEGFGAFVSLAELSIWSCPKLPSSADERFSLPSSLIKLWIRHLPTHLQPYFPDNQTSLRQLEIERSPNLESLRLESCTALEKLEIQGCEQLAVLEGLQYLGSLRRLHIKMNFELFAACQEQYEGSDHARLPPPSVEVVEINNLREEILPCFLAQLPSLSTLVVSKSPNLTSLQLGSDLKVRGCPRVQIGGYELCHRLERVWIDDLSALTTSFCEHLTSLQCLAVWEDKVTRQLTDEQEEALQLLTSLRELSFRFCLNLVRLPVGLHSLPSLKRLEICFCMGISRLPEKGLPPSLEELDITGCSEELNAHCRMLATSKLKVTIL